MMQQQHPMQQPIMQQPPMQPQQPVLQPMQALPLVPLASNTSTIMSPTSVYIPQPPQSYYPQLLPHQTPHFNHSTYYPQMLPHSSLQSMSSAGSESQSLTPQEPLPHEALPSQSDVNHWYSQLLAAGETTLDDAKRSCRKWYQKDDKAVYALKKAFIKDFYYWIDDQYTRRGKVELIECFIEVVREMSKLIEEESKKSKGRRIR